MKRKIYIITLAVLLFSGTPAVCEERSPFEEASKNLLNYETALTVFSLKGIITTEKNGRAVFLVHGEYLALAQGEKFSVTVEGLKHTFTLKAVEEKNVILKGGNGKTYEVSP